MARALELSFIQNNASTDTETTTSGLKFVRRHNAIAVAAIDIGNTYTKCLVSFPHEQAETFVYEISSDYDHGYTAVLLDDNERLDSVGFPALLKYKEEQKGHLFRDIKQPLYDPTKISMAEGWQLVIAQFDCPSIHLVQLVAALNSAFFTGFDVTSNKFATHWDDILIIRSGFQRTKNMISSDIYLSDELGRKTKAVTVFQAIIKRAVDGLESRIGSLRQPKDIQWILTVPTVFTEEAVSVIRRSAVEAGIPEEDIGIVPEPVAALACCLYEKQKKESTYSNRRQESASLMSDMFSGLKKYMVVDIGDKTLDVTVLETYSHGKVKELYKVCDTGLGGKVLNKTLDSLLSSLVRPEVYTCFTTKDYGYENMDFHHRFNRMLMSSELHKRIEMHLTLPGIFSSDGCLKDALKKSPYFEEISVRADKMVFSTAFLKKVLAEYCLTLVTFIKAVWQKNEYEITDILLVGGFAKIKTLKEIVMREFPSVDVFIPDNPDYVTAHGAALLEIKSPANSKRAQNSLKKAEVENASDYLEDYLEDDQSRGSDFVESIRKMSLSSDLLNDGKGKTSSKFHSGLKSLNSRIKGAPQKILLRRKEIISDVIAAYREIDVSRPLDVRFDGEENTEVTEEMFGIFWETVTNVWFTGENAFIPHVPVGKIAEARQVFPILGKVLEHMLCILGYFPPQLCRSLVLTIADKDVDTELVMEDYLSYLPQRESELLTQDLKQTTLSENTQKRLERFFSVKNVSWNPMSFKEDLQNIAYAELIDSSCMYTVLLRRGISDFAKAHFFDLLDPKSLTTEYRTREATSETVSQLVETTLDESNYSQEEKMLINNVINIISGMSKRQLRRFLIWLTGSPNIPKKIEVSFRSFCGGSKTPLPRRGGNILEMTTGYNSCQELERALLYEINNVCFSSGVHY